MHLTKTYLTAATLIALSISDASASRCDSCDTSLCPASDHLIAPLWEGGVYIEGSWLDLQPISTNGDLEYGTVITLSEDPGNLTAYLQELTPSFYSAYRGNVGYRFPCTNWNCGLGYFHFNSKKSNSTPPLRGNQFIQNFLGGSFISASASEKQKLDQVDLQIGNSFVVDRCLKINPFVGASYGRVERDLFVKYRGYNGMSGSPSLPGKEKSSFWGVGPLAGLGFNYPLFCSLSLEGRIAGGAFIGRLDSELSSNFSINEHSDSFRKRSSDFCTIPFLNSGLEIAYIYALPIDCLGLKLSVGYEVDYYFNAIERIAPYNGYVNNPDTYPVKTSSHLGLGGPYVCLSLIDHPIYRESKCVNRAPSISPLPSCGFFAEVESSWLVASSGSSDLDYAVLHTSGQPDKNLHASPSQQWAGTYSLGYRLPCNVDLWARYFRYSAKARDFAEAGPDQEISSLISSGPSEVTFGRVQSEVEYGLNQYDVIAGKSIYPCGALSLYAHVGMRYADLNREERNGYFDGSPAVATEEKRPHLKSAMSGIGPLFGVDPKVSLSLWGGSFGLAGHIDFSLLVGNIQSTLDQKNNGTFGSTSNDLRICKKQWITPVIDLKGGGFFICPFGDWFTLKLEAGYQFSEYYRAINQVYPALVTGLEQANTNLKLQGPYLAIALYW